MKEILYFQIILKNIQKIMRFHTIIFYLRNKFLFYCVINKKRETHFV